MHQILTNYEAIKEYFMTYIPSQANGKGQRGSEDLKKNGKYTRIVNMLSNDHFKMKINFVLSLSKIFEPFLTIFQNESPLIHVLYEESIGLLKKIMFRFVKNGLVTNTINITKIAVTKPENQVPIEEVETGNTETPADGEVRQMVECYIEIVKYLSKRLPIHNVLIQDAKVIHPLYRKEETKDAMKRLALHFPQMISPNDIAIIGDEFMAYQSDDAALTEALSNFDVSGRADHFWREVGQMKNTACRSCEIGPYPNICKIAQIVLTIPHGNADVERSLSINRNVLIPERTKLSKQTLIGLRICKDAIKSHGGVSKVPITKQLIQAHRNSHRKYQIRCEAEKEKSEKENTVNTRIPETSNDNGTTNKHMMKKLESLKSKEKVLKEKEEQMKEHLKIAHKLIEEGNHRLAKGIHKKGMVEIGLAQTMLEGGRDKIATVQNAAEKCTDKRQKLEKRKAKFLDLTAVPEKKTK